MVKNFFTACMVITCFWADISYALPGKELLEPSAKKQKTFHSTFNAASEETKDDLRSMELEKDETVKTDLPHQESEYNILEVHHQMLIVELQVQICMEQMKRMLRMYNL